MSDTPLTVAPAIQRLALALSALSHHVAVNRVKTDDGARYGDSEFHAHTPTEYLATVAEADRIPPHPAIMALVAALRQARERLAEVARKEANR